MPRPGGGPDAVEWRHSRDLPGHSTAATQRSANAFACLKASAEKMLADNLISICPGCERATSMAGGKFEQSETRACHAAGFARRRSVGVEPRSGQKVLPPLHLARQATCARRLRTERAQAGLSFARNVIVKDHNTDTCLSHPRGSQTRGSAPCGKTGFQEGSGSP